LAAVGGNAVGCLGVKSRAQGGEYLPLLNDTETGEPCRDPRCRGENESSDVTMGGLAITARPPAIKTVSDVTAGARKIAKSVFHSATRIA